MQIKFEREIFPPSTDSRQELIDSCAKDLFPEDQILSEWHNVYVLKHKLRIATDLDIVRSKVTSHSDVLELGSIPLLLTTALSKCNYNVTGCDIAPQRYSSTIKATGLNDYQV